MFSPAVNAGQIRQSPAFRVNVPFEIANQLGLSAHNPHAAAAARGGRSSLELHRPERAGGIGPPLQMPLCVHPAMQDADNLDPVASIPKIDDVRSCRIFEIPRPHIDIAAFFRPCG